VRCPARGAACRRAQRRGIVGWTTDNLRLALYSLDVFHRLRAEIDLAYDLQTVGSLKIFSNPQAHEDAANACVQLRDLGLEYRCVDAAECVGIEPALADAASTLAGGIYYPGDESGDCRKFTEAIATRARSLGVSFMFGTTVTGLDVSGGALGWVETDRGRVTGESFVLATGAHSPLLGRRIGINLPIYPVKGVTVTVPIGRWNGAPRVTVVDDARKFAVVRLGDQVRTAGSAEFTGYDTTPDPARCQAILDNATRVFPELAACIDGATATRWAGLRPMTPDGPPVLGATPVRNLFVNSGGGHLGWTFSCGAARLVADLVSNRRPEIGLEGLTLERFTSTSPRVRGFG